MTTFSDIQQLLESDLQAVNLHITRALASPNALMNAVISRYLERKGKQIRPIMVLLAARMLGGVNAKAISGAAAVELLHNASLIHDDVVDDTPTRRGAPTINGHGDNHLAVLVGDFFLSNALLQSVATADIRVVQAISNLGRLLSIGELDEMQSARCNNLSESTYFEIIFRKTASLFVACVEVGAYATDADEHQLQALREYARLLGMAFQIKDDVFDYFPNPKLGKPTGNDLREGKITLPLIHALSLTDRSDREAMLKLAQQDSPDARAIEQLINYAIECGGIDYAYATMERLRTQAETVLCNAFPPSQAREAMLSLFNFIIARDI